MKLLPKRNPSAALRVESVNEKGACLILMNDDGRKLAVVLNPTEIEAVCAALKAEARS